MAPEPPPSPPRKKTSGLTIVLAVIGGGLVLLGIAGAIGAYLVFSSPKGRAIVGAVGDAIKLSSKAKKAPGTKELRAMGCADALVMDAEDFAKMMGHFDAGALEDPPFGEMVVCGSRPWGAPPPSCERVANTYVGAVGKRPKPFVVSVQQAGKKDGCVVLFDGAAVPMEGMFDGDDPSSFLPEDAYEDGAYDPSSQEDEGTDEEK